MAGPSLGPTPQPVLTPLTTAAVFLVVTVDAGGEPVARELLSDLPGLQRAVGFRAPNGALSCVAGIGSFGSAGRGEFGTYFIGYARTPAVTETMLERMFLGEPPAAHDRILDFSTAVTGMLFFVPAADFLEDLPDPPGADAAIAIAIAGTGTGTGRTAPGPHAPHPDDSLRIGDMKRSTADEQPPP
ncbi:Dyp-type peroxidase [Streptomyces sp. RB6PN25]|uniref:Dyp-type peroxidase n=1 Tax=Streptomyces humicola TaxID=2953240 RepID=A0ABT1Q0Y3_9ACTN|nr:Dyp-type peroxidase domain-containing protein [Streptomyces humicola]MCQ4082445.1 Dyp-type peroxidase [Streptomyces humicola]